MVDIKWVRIESWHVIEDTTYDDERLHWQVKTLCGLVRPWDQTYADTLPGGTAKSCENCLVVLAGNVDEEK